MTTITTPETTAEVAGVSRSDAVAATWNDPAVAAARKERNSVEVDGVHYGSVSKAFAALNLPMAKHVNFRMALKASESGTASFGDFAFRLMPAGTPPPPEPAETEGEADQ